MMSRTQITLDPEIHRRARKRAADLGISFAEYIRSLVAKDLRSPRKPADVSILFALGESGGTDIARDKDSMIAAAVDAERPRNRPVKTRQR